jgi:2-octaprenyl-6-methoxyphenol hydroxylase
MNFDIVIIGGGMVGASLAAALSGSTLRTALVDANSAAALNDPRLIALNYGSIQFLKSLNLFEPLQSIASAIHEVHVSKKGCFGSTRIKAKEVSLPVLGYVIPAKNINAVLENALQSSNLERIRPATLIKLVEKEGKMELTLRQSSGEILTIQTNLVIAADGTHSTVRELLSIPVIAHDYQQSAIVAIVELARPHQHIAYERFVDRGAIAMLPLTKERSAMIWTADQAKVDSLMELGEEDFLVQLQREFGFKLGRLQKIATRAMFPLKVIQSKKRVYGRIILIGNAAHTIHPLAAQGFNLALHEVELLSQLILSTSMNTLNLQSFEKYSLSEQVTLQFSGCLNALFSTDLFPVKWVRQMGMIGLNTSGIIKRQISLLLAGVR